MRTYQVGIRMFMFADNPLLPIGFSVCSMVTGGCGTPECYTEKKAKYNG
jgi:hypothetical protein